MMTDYEAFMLNVGQALKAARENLGMTQAELAKLAETSQSAICSYESGRICMTIWTLARLCRVLGVPASDVMGEFDARNDNS